MAFCLSIFIIYFVLLSHSHWLRERCNLEQKIVRFVNKSKPLRANPIARLTSGFKMDLIKREIPCHASLITIELMFLEIYNEGYNLEDEHREHRKRHNNITLTIMIKYLCSFQDHGYWV